MKILSKNIFSYTFVILILTFAVTFRIYNLNYEDFWIDEILSFWIADPSLSLSETVERHNNLEQIPILFNLILKYFFKIFGYNAYLGRYLITSFSILSLIISFILISKITNNKSSFFFFCILISLNIYLIKYSFELRVYSLLIFLISLSTLYYIKLIDNGKNYHYVIFFIFTFLSIISHPFALIVFLSMINYSLMISIKTKIISKLNITLFLLLIFSLVYYFMYFLNLNEITSWITQVNFKFFTNYFFSKFFGSRLLGLLHLLILLNLIIHFKNKIFNSILLFFLLIIFYSYTLPLIFSFLIKPILVDRYIIFVIIPILIITSCLIFEIKNNVLKNVFSSFLLIATLLNFYTESPIQQFFETPKKYKPEFSNALKEIQKSENKNLLVKKFMPYSSSKKSFYELLDKSVKDYLIHLNHKLDLDIYIIDEKKINNDKLSKLWILCYSDLDVNDCKLPMFKKKFSIIENINFSKINLKKIKIEEGEL